MPTRRRSTWLHSPVNVPTEGPGDLKLNIYFNPDSLVPPIPFDLNLGDSTDPILLGVLGTDETTVNPGDDLAPQQITIDWEFDAPSLFNGTSTGTTVGILESEPPGHLSCGSFLAGGCGQVVRATDRACVWDYPEN